MLRLALKLLVSQAYTDLCLKIRMSQEGSTL